MNEFIRLFNIYESKRDQHLSMMRNNNAKEFNDFSKQVVNAHCDILNYLTDKGLTYE